MNPLVSIIVPCYNQAQYLDECLQSVVEQTFENWECIIVNDGSPDNTEKIAQEWVSRDYRFKYYHKENEGVSSARNLGILKSLGEFLLTLDGDDKLGQDYLRLIIEEFKNDKSLTIVYSNARFFGTVEKFWNLPNFELKEFLLDNCIYCSAIFKKVDFLKTGGYDENMKYGYEDWEFWINLISHSDIFKVKKIDYVGFYYRRKTISRDIEFLNDQVKIISTKFEIYQKHHNFYDQHFGGYIDNIKKFERSRKKNEQLLKSKKYVLKLFLKVFFGIKFKEKNR